MYSENYTLTIKNLTAEDLKFLSSWRDTRIAIEDMQNLLRRYERHGLPEGHSKDISDFISILREEICDIFADVQL